MYLNLIKEPNWQNTKCQGRVFCKEHVFNAFTQLTPNFRFIWKASSGDGFRVKSNKNLRMLRKAGRNARLSSKVRWASTVDDIAQQPMMMNRNHFIVNVNDKSDVDVNCGRHFSINCLTKFDERSQLRWKETTMAMMFIAQYRRMHRLGWISICK